MARAPLTVEVVSADRRVWEGEAVNIIARTVEGDIGILPGHEPLLAMLVPSVVEIVTTDGRTETLAIDGGFLSVAADHVWVLSQDAITAEEVTLDEAHRELAELTPVIDQGQADDEQKHRARLLQAQIRAAERNRETD